MKCVASGTKQADREKALLLFTTEHHTGRRTQHGKRFHAANCCFIHNTERVTAFPSMASGI
jgi:hypothetical protein